MSCFQIGNHTSVSYVQCCNQIAALALKCNLDAARERLAEWHSKQDWTHAPKRRAVAGGFWGISRAEAIRQSRKPLI